MHSRRSPSNQQNSRDQCKSDSTIQLEFSESIVQMLRTRGDMNSNSHASIQQYYSRKRCASSESEKTTNEEENINKKQRNNNDRFVLSKTTRNKQIVSLSESDETPCIRTDSKQQQQQNGLICQRSASIPNVCDHRLDWLKDFMRQSLDTIRDTVVQACITAISTRSISPLNANMTTQEINVNNHRTRLARSEHSFTSRHTMGSWQRCQLRKPSVMQSKNDVLLLHNRLDDEEDVRRKQRTHHRARTSPYPMCKTIFRTPVSDTRVPWSYEWPQYRPTIFTAEEIYINPGADPDLLKSPSSISLHFNTIDSAIDRRSVYHHYYVREADGLPLNPIGRTGLQGRGVLLRWGPNIYHYTMICRWKRDTSGRILLHPSNGKKILEILLELQTDGRQTNDLILTGGLRMLGSRFPPQLQDRLKRFIVQTETIFNDRKKIPSSLAALNHLFKQNPIPWKGAYFDDARNTDNAWIELSIEYFLDSDHQLTSCIPSLPYEQLHRLDQPRFVWKDVRQTIDIGPRTHYCLIRNLASKLDAYF